MNQVSFSEAEYTVKKRKTRREKFLEQIDGLIPWKRWEKKLARHDANPGHGRRPYPLSVMLRVHCMQLFYNLSDPAMEDVLYEIESMRRFAGRRLSGPLPDETTILKCRHFLEKHPLGKVILKEVNRHLEKKVCCCEKARWLTRRSSLRRHRQSIHPVGETRKGIRRKKATNGTLA